MAHIALLDGTNYQIWGGKTLIDGTVYSIMATKESGGCVVVEGQKNEWFSSSYNTNTVSVDLEDENFDWSRYDIIALSLIPTYTGTTGEMYGFSWINGTLTMNGFQTYINVSKIFAYSVNFEKSANGKLKVNISSQYGQSNGLRFYNPKYWIVLAPKN